MGFAAERSQFASWPERAKVFPALKTLHFPRENGLETYLQELQKLPPLTGEEGAQAFAAAAAGDQNARERIVLAHLSLVVRIAWKYGGYGLPLTDVISEGNLGLLRAAELYDPKYGVAFATYAGVWIKQRIHRAITAQAHAVRIPVWRSQRLRKLDRLHAELNAELGRDAVLADLAERIGIAEDDLADIASDRVEVTSLSQPAPDGNPWLEIPDDAQLHPRERLSQEERREEIIAALAGLDDTELQIISRKFGLNEETPESYREMAPRFGRSREWIRRMGEQAIAKIAASLRAAGGMPRALIASRQGKTRKRLADISRKTADPAAKLSVFQAVLMPWMEPIFTIL